MEETTDKDPAPGGGRDEAPKSSASRVVRFSTLSLLYLVQVKHRFSLMENSSQGAPYGFQTACLPLLLRQALGRPLLLQPLCHEAALPALGVQASLQPCP